MTLKLEHLRGFATVARCGNLADAADILGRTPSALSMMLKQLEDHLGEPLFETDRKSRLTPLGAFVLDQAERQVQAFDNTARAIEGYAKATRGRVKIAAVPSVAATLLPRLFTRHPGILDQISIDLRDMDSHSILQELEQGRIDIGIATPGPAAPGLTSQLLLSDAFGVIAARSHPLAAMPGPVRWSDLSEHRLISNNLSANIKGDGPRALHENTRLSAHNLTSLLAMVESGVGVAILPEMTIHAGNSSGLVFRPLADATIRRQIHLIYRGDMTLSPAARRIERLICETTQTMQDRNT